MISRNTFCKQRELLKHRMWPAALSVLLYFLYHVVLVATSYFNAIQNSSARLPEDVTDELYDTFTNLFSVSTDGGAAIIAILLGVLFAIQGFAYLHNRCAVDFYESQPVSRTSRFISITWNSILLFLVPYLATLVIGLAISAGFHAIPAASASGVLQEMLRVILLFLACYFAGVLAVMLTGNTIISMLAAATLLLYGPVLQYLIYTCRSAYFGFEQYSTYPYGPQIWSPISVYMAHSMVGINGILVLLLYVLLFGILAYLAYQKRPAEAAGKTVLWKSVRMIVKIAITMLVALLVAFTFGYDSQPAIPIFFLLLGGIIIGSVMEIIYASDFRALFKHSWQTCIGILAALAVFCAFAFDLTGYNSWVPNPADVEDAAILTPDYYTDHYYEGGSSCVRTGDFYKQYMHLTDVDTVTKLAKQMQSQPITNDSIAAFSTPVTVLYRMKNGKTASRTFYIYEDTDTTLFNEILGSQEFKEGYFQIYHDDYVRKYIKDYGTLTVDSIGQEHGTGISGSKYEDFRNALISDIESTFDYDFASTHLPIARIYVSVNSSERGTVLVSYEIYEDYTETMNFLKKNGIDTDVLIQNSSTAVDNSSPFNDGIQRFDDTESAIETVLS